MNNKYIIYQNDLKFRNLRNLDKTKIDWSQNNILHLYNIDHDTLEYRINESNTNNNSDLDLRHLELISIPIELNQIKFINLNYLFLSNNKLAGLIDFTNFINLHSLDIDNNQITDIKIPNSLLELSINDNRLIKFTCNKNLIRLKASNNNITHINLGFNLEILEIDNNRLSNLNINNLNKLKRLIIFLNPLSNIKITKSIEYIDISETNINQIVYDNPDCILDYKLEHLVANSCKELKSLPQFNNLKNLELINTPVDKLYYYSNFELIIVQLNLTKNISKRYKDNNANIQIRKNTLLVISRGVIINDNF